MTPARLAVPSIIDTWRVLHATKRQEEKLAGSTRVEHETSPSCIWRRRITMRYRTLLSQFQAAVDRVDDTRTTWNALAVALWQQGAKAQRPLSADD